MCILKRKMNWLLRENVQLRKDYPRLRQRWTEEIGNEDMLIWPFMSTNRELESQRLELYQATQWADQAQREKISLF